LKKIFKDDFYLNKTLRRQLKIEKSIIKKEEEEKNKERNFNLPLLDFTEEDQLKANTANFRNKDLIFKTRDSKRLESIMNFNPLTKHTRNIIINGNIIKCSSSKSINNQNEKNITNKDLNNLLEKKHRMDISLQKTLEYEIKKDRESLLSNCIFKRIEKVENGVLLGRKTFLKKKE